MEREAWATWRKTVRMVRMICQINGGTPVCRPPHWKSPDWHCPCRPPRVLPWCLRRINDRGHKKKKPGNFRHFQPGSTRKSQSRDLYSLAAHCFGFAFFLSASRYVSVGPSLSLTIFSPYTSTIDDLVAVGQFRRSRSGGCSSVVCGSGRHERGKLQEDHYHPRHPILCVVQMFHFISH